MKTELEKCMNGGWYDCHAQIFMALKIKTRELLLQYNFLPKKPSLNLDIIDMSALRRIS